MNDHGGIRNFCILAHIDHGKSTLADRLLELTKTVADRQMHEQYLDQMELEQEKGITIKMQPVRMEYHPQNQISNIKYQKDNSKIKNNNSPQANTDILPFDSYILNLIDTPGHVDFTYEVSRSLACVEGVILLVDATQGIQAQSIANLHLAKAEGLTIVPAVSKVDLASAEIEKTKDELVNILGIAPETIYEVSGKTGQGIEDMLDGVITRVPAPIIKPDAPLRALVFDSLYDPYQGIIAYVRIVDGTLKKGQRIRFMVSGTVCEVPELGVLVPNRLEASELTSGEIGYIVTGVKEPEQVRVGDTVTISNFQFPISRQSIGKISTDIKALPGYLEPVPMVFASIFPKDQDAYEVLRDALKRLQLEDSALTFEPEQSGALGRGYRSGFLGMLHMEIVSERLKREYDLELIFTNPSVSFEIRRKDGSEELIYAAYKMPAPHELDRIKEPWGGVEVVTPPRYLGPLTALIHQHDGTIIETVTLLEGARILIRFEAPIREIIVDFYDKLKSATQGFASMTYHVLEYREGDLMRLDLLVAGEHVPAFAEVLPRRQVDRIGRARVERLKELLPRELFSIALQAEVEGRIIARETIPALKKDVTGYLYGGDRTRKMKLWKKQQKGKKKLQSRAHVDIPEDVFLKMLRK